jgi:hypothetical protein
MLLSIAFVFLGRAYGQDVFTVKVKAVDANGIGVPDVLLELTGYGAVFTGADGCAVLQLPKGRYNVTATFMRVNVGEATLDIYGDGDYTIAVGVFSLHVTVLDSQGTPLPNVEVKAYVGREVQSESTDNLGVAVFQHLPSATVRVKAYANNTLIGETEITLTRNSEVSIRRETYFKSIFHVVDLEGLPMSNVLVTAAGSESVSNSSGDAEVYLKHGIHKVSFILYGLKVYEFTITVAGDASYNATIKASTLEALLLDEFEKPYIGAATLHVGEVNLTADTDASGTLRVKQIPHGKLSISTALGVPTNFTFAGEPLQLSIVTRELRLTASILSAYMLGALKIKATVYIGEQPLKAAVVKVYASSGVYTKKTDGSGHATFEIPIGLERTTEAKVEASGYGQSKTVPLSSETSPLVLIVFPFTFAPLIAFAILTSIYRKQISLS